MLLMICMVVVLLVVFVLLRRVLKWLAVALVFGVGVPGLLLGVLFLVLRLVGAR